MSQCYASTEKGTRCRKTIEKDLFCSDHTDYGKLHLPLLTKFLNSCDEFTQLYTLDKPLLTKSQFGQLFFVTHKATGKPAVLKTKLQSKFAWPADRLDREVGLLHNDFSPQYNRIIQLIDTFTLVFPNKEDETMLIVAYTMEPVVCDLYEFWVTKKQGNPSIIKTVGKQLIQMMNQFHKSGYVYCDVSLTNIGVRCIKPLDLVLLDFGMSYPEPRIGHGSGGTAFYSSLACELDQRISYRDDMESIGYILLALITNYEIAKEWEDNDKRVEQKTSLKGIPSFIRNYIMACRAIPLHEKPNYKALLSILGGQSTNLFDHYITPSTTWVDYGQLDLLRYFDGIKGNDKNDDILDSHGLQNYLDLNRFLNKHQLGLNNIPKFVQAMVKLGLPKVDAEKFVAFIRYRK